MKQFKLLSILLVFFISACAALQNLAPTQTSPTPAIPTAPATATDLPPIQPAPTAEPSLAPSDTPTPAPNWIAYIGRDGNLWLLNHTSGEQQQITSDAAPYNSESDAQAVQYCCAAWSSDGQFLAYKRDVGTPIQAGYSVAFGLWVYDTQTRHSRVIFENQSVAGFAWKPSTHLLAFGLGIEMDYFSARGVVDTSKAKGIWGVNLDNGENMELVPPQNGYSLVNPVWSRDGRFLAFDEVLFYEGRGNFAYFDFEVPEYVAWDMAIGGYDWSPDGNMIAFDTQTYVANGTERIFLRLRLDGSQQQFSPDYELGYAFYPRFSPDGAQIAYLAEIGAPESGQYTLFVQPVTGGEPRSLGVFDHAGWLSWLPDGSGLVFATGPYEGRQIFEVSLNDWSARLLAEGNEPSIIP